MSRALVHPLAGSLRPLWLVAFALAVTALAGVVPYRSAHAFPPAGTDVLAAAGQASLESRLGAETIDVSGTVTVQRGDPYLDGADEVVDTEIVSMSLTGTSSAGPIAVVESATLTSTGHVRTAPASSGTTSSFFDVFAVVTAPASPAPTIQLGNSSPIHLDAPSHSSAWPPQELKYASTPLQGVDNDGDTRVDEDSSDEDGDHMYDEDGPGGGNPDTDARLDEDPSLAQCTLALCDADGDALIDEDPACVPLFPTLPVGACVVSLTITVYGDTDRDGCSDKAELQTAPGSQATGGLRNPLYFWDVMDVPTGPTVRRDRIVTGGDIAALVGRFGSNDEGPGPFSRSSDPLSTPYPAVSPSGVRANYHPAYDRAGAQPGGPPWNLRPPDGRVSGGDISAAVVQFGHSCLTPPP